MRILIFIILATVIGGFLLTLIARPLRKAKNAVINRINRSFEEEKETEEDDRKGF